MTGQLKDRKKARQDGSRAGQVQDKPDAGQEESQTGWIQDRAGAGQEEYQTGWIQCRAGAGQASWRTGRMPDRMERILNAGHSRCNYLGQGKFSTHNRCRMRKRQDCSGWKTASKTRSKKVQMSKHDIFSSIWKGWHYLVGGNVQYCTRCTVLYVTNNKLLKKRLK